MFFDVTVTLQIGERKISAEIRSDEKLTALVGPSGAGKTSVLDAIAGLRRPESGRIAVAGETLFDITENIDLAPNRRRAGYVFQDARLFPHKRVDANLSYGERQADSGASCIPREEIIDLLAIGNLLRRWPTTLSGGETRRVAIARALLSGPRFLLLDEPFSSLDAERAETLSLLIERIRDEFAIPILLVSHTAAEVDRLARKTVRLDGG